MKRLTTAALIAITACTGAQAEDVSLTVYNNDLAIVKIADDMTFRKGEQTVTFTGVADRIDPTSVRFSAKDGTVTVIEQNYRYDLANSRTVLERYVDKDVALVVDGGGMIEGILQSVAGDIVLKDRSGKVNIVRLDAIERYDLPELPDGLVTRPTLFWKLLSTREGTTGTEVSYMTGGFSWHAEYTAVVSGDEKSMELSSWVSVDNQSGATFENAGLKLVAGDVHRAPRKDELFAAAPRAMMQEDAAAKGFEEREFFEYHMYDLGRRTDVMNKEIKQISLFEPSIAGATKLYVYDPRKNDSKVAVNLEFVNSEKNGLGMALPAGTVRLFKRDTDDSIEFIGEDSIDHTPRNEKVRLMLGYAFDIAVERTVTDTRRVTDRVREQSFEVSLRNRKTEKVTVTVADHFWGDWSIVTSSADYTKKDAYTVEFPVSIPADEEVKITYTVRMR